LARRDEIVDFANELLEVERFPEYGRPGLQVVGAGEVGKLVVGVSSSRDLFERAVAAGAQMVLVHHGLFWRNEPLVVDRRLRGRLEALFRGDVSLVAYHLALDAHPEIGNNAILAARLGGTYEGAFAEIGAAASFDGTIDELAARLREATGRDPVVFPHGPERIRRVAVVTGGGGTRLIEAAHRGFDALVTGEPEEPALETARELGIHFLAGGHYATETFGV
jgi:dinuclear metal center YbgI/SA1388 family protein